MIDKVRVILTVFFAAGFVWFAWQSAGPAVGLPMLVLFIHTICLEIRLNQHDKNFAAILFVFKKNKGKAGRVMKLNSEVYREAARKGAEIVGTEE